MYATGADINWAKGSGQPGARRPRRLPWLCSQHRQRERPLTQCVGDMDWAGCGLELRALLAIPLLCPCVSGSGDLFLGEAQSPVHKSLVLLQRSQGSPPLRLLLSLSLVDAGGSGALDGRLSPEVPTKCVDFQV